MSDLTDFLLARIEEDEAAAQAVTVPMHYAYLEPDPERAAWVEHFRRHEPARTLADLGGKRRLVEGVREFQESGSPLWTRPPWFRSDSKWHGDTPYVLRCLSMAYAEHPDYREEWKP